MKKSVIFLMALCLMSTFTSCGNEEKDNSSSQIAVSTTEESVSDTTQSEILSEETESTSDILVAYFTYAENADISDNTDASSSASIQL